jgi:hypothetical protein
MGPYSSSWTSLVQDDRVAYSRPRQHIQNSSRANAGSRWPFNSADGGDGVQPEFALRISNPLWNLVDLNLPRHFNYTKELDPNPNIRTSRLPTNLPRKAGK